MNGDRKKHSVLRLDAGDRVEGDCGQGSRLLCRGWSRLRSSSLLLESSHSGNLHWDFVIEEIRRLKIEESRTHMATHVGLVAVVA
jgi:hypothetical protein